jgi:AbrB family looped-hinge helix DNA binding protein
MANNVTSKGQVTIPKKVRDRLGIEAGSAVGEGVVILVDTDVLLDVVEDDPTWVD